MLDVADPIEHTKVPGQDKNHQKKGKFSRTDHRRQANTPTRLIRIFNAI